MDAGAVIERLTFRSPTRWVFVLWMVCGVFFAMIGATQVGRNGTWAVIGFGLALVFVAAGWTGASLGLEVTPNGITYKAFFRRIHVAADDVRDLALSPVGGVGPFDRALIDLIKIDGSTVRLEPTLVVNSGPTVVRKRIELIRAVLSLPAGPPGH